MNQQHHDLLALISDARRIVSDDRQIWCTASETFDSRLVRGRGLLLGGAISPHFLRDVSGMSADVPWGVRLRHCRVIVCDTAAHEPLSVWLTLMEDVAGSGEALLVVTETIESELLSTFVVNAFKGTLRVCVVQPPRDRFGNPAPGTESLGPRFGTPPSARDHLPRVDEVWIRRTASACLPIASDPVPVATVLQDIVVIETGGENHEDQYDRLRFLMRALQRPEQV